MALESRADEDLSADYVKGKLLDVGRRRADGADEDKALLLGGIKYNTTFRNAKKLTTNKEKQCH